MPSTKLLHRIAALLCCLFSAVSLCGTAIAAAPAERPQANAIELKFANFPAATTFPCISMERWAKEVETRTNGAVSVKTFPAGTLVSARNMLRGVTSGQADIGCVSFAYFPGVYPAMSVFELPLGFRSAREASGVMWEAYAALAPKELQNVKVIALFSSAPSQVLSVKPVASANDLKGLRLRASGNISAVVKAMGANPVSMPQSETSDALQKNSIDGILTSYDVMKDYNFAEYCRSVLQVDMPVYPFAFIMNKKKWESLPEEVKKAIDDLGKEHSLYTGDYVDNHAREALEWSIQTYGVKASVLDAAAQEALMRQVAPTIEDWKKGANAKKVNADEVLATVRQLLEQNRAQHTAETGLTQQEQQAQMTQQAQMAQMAGQSDSQTPPHKGE